MLTVSATEVKNKFGQIVDQALREPVMVQNHGRNSVVILGNDEFDRLRRIEDAYWIMRAQEALRSGFADPEQTMARLQVKLAESEEA